MAYSSNPLVSGLSQSSIPLCSSPFPHFSRPLLSIPCNSSSLSSSSAGNSCSVVKLTHFSRYASVLEAAQALPNLKLSSPSKKFVCRAAEYKFPDPIPEFASSETEKFKNHLVKRLSKKDVFGDSLEEVIGICTEIFSTFLHTEYGGPGTLLVIPFVDMADMLEERGLPGGPQAARAAVKWAQDHVDKDWKEWTGTD